MSGRAACCKLNENINKISQRRRQQEGGAGQGAAADMELAQGQSEGEASQGISCLLARVVAVANPTRIKQSPKHEKIARKKAKTFC